MSLVQVWLEDEKARVAVDTLAYPGGARQHVGHVSKLLPLAHAGVVLAYRGSDIAFFQVFAQLFLTPGNDDFDSIETAMPTRFGHARMQWRPDAPAELAGCEYFMVGYSKRLEKMACTQFNLNLRTGKVDSAPMTRRCRLAPGFESVPELTTDEVMLDVAARQVAWMRENAPSAATGGRLLVAEISPYALNIHDAGPIR